MKFGISGTKRTVRNGEVSVTGGFISNKKFLLLLY